MPPWYKTALAIVLSLLLLYTLSFLFLFYPEWSSQEPVRNYTQEGTLSRIGTPPNTQQTQCYDGEFPCCEYNGVCLPGLFIAGFMKCGTVQLATDLRRCHLNVTGLRPEPKGMKERDLDEFTSRLKNISHSDGRLSIASMPLLAHYDRDTLQYMKLNMPDSKYILSLRNPADRDYSHFKMNIRKGWSRYSDSQLPKDCFADSSACLFNMLLDTIVHVHPVWRDCVKDKYGRVLDARDSSEAFETWCSCISTFPDRYWVRGPLECALEKDYMRTVLSFDEVFGRDYWMPIRTEDFFEYNLSTIFSTVNFANLPWSDKIPMCFFLAGNIKDAEGEIDQLIGLNATKMSPTLRRLLLTLHKYNIERLQVYLDKDYHWLDDLP